MSQTTSTIPNRDEASDSLSQSVLVRDGLKGVLVRGLVVTAALVVTVLLLLLAKDRNLLLGDLETPMVLAIGLIVCFGMFLGVVFSEYPRGSEAALARVGLATFCRTGLPLLVVLMAVNYATRLNSVAACVGILYAVGLILSLALEFSRLGLSTSNPPSE